MDEFQVRRRIVRPSQKDDIALYEKCGEGIGHEKFEKGGIVWASISLRLQR